MTSKPMPMITRKELIFLFIIIASAFSLRMVFLHEPLERDEGLYAYIGQEILRGKLPYRDAMDQKPPGIHYIYSAIITVFGATPEGVRVGTAVYSIGTVLALFLCTRRVFGSQAGLWASLLYGIYSSGPLIRGSSSNSEVFMVLPIILSLYILLLWGEKPKVSLLAFSGLLLGSALVIKTVALPHVLVGLAFVLVCSAGKRCWLKIVLDGAIFSFFLSVPLLASALFFYLQGAFDDYYYWTIEFNKMYGQTSPAEFFSRMRLGLTRTAPELLPLVALAVPALITVFSSRRNCGTLLLVASVPAAFIGLSMPTKFFEHYFIQLIPPLSILAGVGMSYLLRQRRAIVVIALIPFAAAVIYWAMTDYKYYLSYSPEEVSRMKYANNDVFVNSVKIAKYIEERTAPSDYIYQWGFEPELYFLSNRRSPNLYTVHFAVAASKDPLQASLDLGRSIITKRPKYIVIQQGRAQYQGFNELREVIDMFYIHEANLYGSQLWHIR